MGKRAGDVLEVGGSGDQVDSSSRLKTAQPCSNGDGCFSQNLENMSVPFTLDRSLSSRLCCPSYLPQARRHPPFSPLVTASSRHVETSSPHWRLLQEERGQPEKPRHLQGWRSGNSRAMSKWRDAQMFKINNATATTTPLKVHFLPPSQVFPSLDRQERRPI